MVCLQEDTLFVEEFGNDFMEVFVTLKKSEIKGMEEIKVKASRDEKELGKMIREFYQIL